MSANLGEASTKELIQELKTRMEMSKYDGGTINSSVIRFKSNCSRALTVLPDEILNYRSTKP